MFEAIEWRDVKGAFAQKPPVTAVQGADRHGGGEARGDQGDHGDRGQRTERDELREARMQRQPDVLDEIMAICKVRDESGRVVLERLAGPEGWPDYARVHDAARGTYLLGAYRGDFGPEVLERWLREIHDPFRSKGNAGRSTELVVELKSALSAEVLARAGERGVQLVRRVDYENIIDVERWREALMRELDGDDRYPNPLYVPQRLTLWSPLDERRAEIAGAAGHLAKLLCEREGGLILVLGAAGTGKTFLLREVARHMIAHQSLVTPILVSLRGLEQARDAHALATWAMLKHKIALPERAFDHELREGRLALLFDGFDELAIRVRASAVPEHFSRILSALQGRARIVVASRAEHFTSQSAAVEVLMSNQAGGAAMAGRLQSVAHRRVGALHGFEPEDVREYLRLKLGEVDGERRYQQLAAVDDLVKLAETPRMLSFILRLTEAQLTEAAKKGLITSAELYRLVIVDAWLADQAECMAAPGGAPAPSAAMLQEAVTRLARHLWRNPGQSVPASAFEAHVGERLRALCEGDGEVAGQWLRARTLLVRADDGGFELVHQTVMEWLVAEALAGDWASAETRAELEGGKLSVFMIDVLRDRLGDEAVGAWAEAVVRSQAADRLAENARAVLGRLGRVVTTRLELTGQDLRGQALDGVTLQGARLDGADLREMDLAGRDLRGASLVKARLGRANLRGADLRGADLTGAELVFARLDGAQLDGVVWPGAEVAGMSAVGATGAFERTTVHCAEAAAWVEADAEVWAEPQCAGVTAVSIHPRLPLVAGGHIDGTVRVWDESTGMLLRVLGGHTSRVTSVCWSADGARLASGSDDNSVRVWDASSGLALRTLEGHTSRVASVCWSPDGARLASGSYDASVRVWDASSFRLLCTLEGHTERVTSLCWSPDGARLASGDNSVSVWDASSGRLLRRFKSHTNGTTSVCWKPDGARLASGSDDNFVRVWDASSGRLLRTLEGHRRSVTCVCWSPDGAQLASGSYDASVRVWDATSLRLLYTLEGHTDCVTSVCWSSDGARLASGSEDNSVRVWDASSGRLLRTFKRHMYGVTSVCWSPDGAQLVSSAYDKFVRVWDASSGRVLQKLEGHTKRVTSVCWSPDGVRLASGSDDNSLRVWDASSGRVLQELEGHTSGVASLCWSLDGARLASGSDDYSVRVWEASSGRLLRTLEGHTLWVTSVCWSPDGALLASASWDQSVRVWEASSGRLLRTLEGHTLWVTSVCWSPDGALLASASWDKSVRVWEASSGRLLHTLEGHIDQVRSVCWSPDGTRLASGSGDNSVRVWDPSSGQQLRRLETPGRQVASVAWHPRMPFLATAHNDGIRLWDFDRAQSLATFVSTPDGAIAFRASDGRYRIQGSRSARVARTAGLVRFGLGELDGGRLALADDAVFLPV
jgi:WD40 repeat protein